MVSERFVRAEALCALWVLGGGGDLPASGGELDRALHATRATMPAALAEGLTFSATGVGLRCLELPTLLLAAEEAMLAVSVWPTYRDLRVTLDPERARQVALGAGLSTEDAAAAGRALVAAARHREASGETGRHA